GYFSFEDIFKMLPSGEIVFDDSRQSVFEHAQNLFVMTKRENAYPDPVEIPEQNMYSQEEINEMVLDQTQLIRDLDINVSQAELNWRKAKQTATDGIVRAAHDGTVVAVGDPYAPQGDQALIQVKSGNGYEITSTISENQLNTIKVGDQISVMMWSNGMTYTGTITKVSPYPAEYSMSYSGDGGNVSYYPFIASLDCDDELQPWDGGEITFLSDMPSSKAEFALQSCFIREENGRNYVLKADENGKMVKQYIEVGRILYGGYYIEVYGGLSLEDYIAFPYGKNAVEGAKADYESGVMGW
ncbi:MAG: HlyD family efflux transporter periplasmic adaptor subunit, partial [Oscillospiraceae bacterium]|nr:HlyD family efflux transporter periplasmic adaptor subunit [Oscillospiraceae bacterium]